MAVLRQEYPEWKRHVMARRRELGRYPVLGGAYLLAGRAAAEVKQRLTALGLPAELVRRAAVATYEAEMNICIHAIAGEVILTEKDGRVLVSIQDRGPGIADLEQALTPGFSTASEKARQRGFGAGLGFSNMQRCSDEFSVTSQPGTGTRVEMTFLLRLGKKGAAGCN